MRLLVVSKFSCMVEKCNFNKCPITMIRRLIRVCLRINRSGSGHDAHFDKVRVKVEILVRFECFLLMWILWDRCEIRIIIHHPRTNRVHWFKISRF